MAAHEIQNYHAKLDLLNSKVNSKSDQLVAEVIWFGILEKIPEEFCSCLQNRIFEEFLKNSKCNFWLEIQLTLDTVHLVIDTIFLAKIPQGVVCCHYRKSFIWIVFLFWLKLEFLDYHQSLWLDPKLRRLMIWPPLEVAASKQLIHHYYEILGSNPDQVLPFQLKLLFGPLSLVSLLQHHLRYFRSLIECLWQLQPPLHHLSKEIGHFSKYFVSNILNHCFSKLHDIRKYKAFL